jgi:hypothetical protein
MSAASSVEKRLKKEVMISSGGSTPMLMIPDLKAGACSLRVRPYRMDLTSNMMRVSATNCGFLGFLFSMP